MTYVNTEEMRRAAATAESAADSMRRSASTVEEAVTRIAQLFEPGYGGNGLRLTELLENFEVPDPAANQEAKPVADDAGSALAVAAKSAVKQLKLWMKDHGQDIASQEAIAAINVAIAAAPQAQTPAADLASWKARALEAENTVLKWEARATALDHASLDAILSALEDPQHQAEQEAEKAFYRNEGLELAALVGEDTDVAIQKFGGQVYDDGGQTRSDIVAAIRARKTQLPQEVQA